jgi:hypothetical protein
MAGRKYFGQTRIEKCYRGEKSVNLRLRSLEASLLAEKLLRAVNDGRKTIDIAVYDPGNQVMKSGDKARITVTSGA